MVFISSRPQDYDFGEAVAPVSDLDLDGVPELRIRAWFLNNQSVLVPRTYIYSGASGSLKFSIIGDDPFDPWAVVDGDADGDGDVDGDDVAIVQANLGLAGPDLTTYDGDFNGDGLVNGANHLPSGASVGRRL